MSEEQTAKEVKQAIKQFRDGIHHAIDLTPDIRQEVEGFYMDGWHAARNAFRAGEQSGHRETMEQFAQFKLGFIEAPEKRHQFDDPEIDPDELEQPPDQYIEGIEAYDKAYLAGVRAARSEVDWRLFQQGYVDARGGFEKPQKSKPSYLKGWELYQAAYQKGFAEGERVTTSQILAKGEKGYKKAYEKLVNHFAPIVLTHPQFKPDDWGIPDLSKSNLEGAVYSVRVTDSDKAAESQPTIPPDGNESESHMVEPDVPSATIEPLVDQTDPSLFSESITGNPPGVKFIVPGERKRHHPGYDDPPYRD